jgi:hypothetical protein
LRTGSVDERIIAGSIGAHDRRPAASLAILNAARWDLDDPPLAELVADRHAVSCQAAGTPSAALRSSALSSFRIPSIALIARSARFGSGSANSSSIPVGVTCHDRSYLSLSQPHGPSSPPSDSRSQ